jgi:hypothetical protein
MADSGPMRTDEGEDLLAGYVTGPAAASEATTAALPRAEAARAVVLVEGVSDQIAVETLAGRRGRDLAAEGVVVLAAAGMGTAGSRADLERLGFFVCVEDLEDELIRAAGPARVTEAFAAHGDLGAFRTIQRQPAWRGREEAAQLRRFLGAGARRKLRYARLLTEAVSLDRVPYPLTALLAAV